MIILRFFAKWVASVLMAIFFLIGLLDSFDATKGMIAWVKPFGAQPIHVAFIVFALAAAYITTVQGISISRLERKRPKIKVEPKVYNNRAILEVQNIGGEADFTAKARVVSGSPEPELYTMYWESVQDIKCNINAGDTASILVGEISQTTSESINIFTGGLTLFKVGTSGEQIFGVSTLEAIEQPKLKQRYPTMDVKVPEDKCIIEITLTATPSLVKAFDRRRYSIEIDHIHGNKLLFTALSNSYN